jgi:putative ABC transport system ATP-binding protein
MNVLDVKNVSKSYISGNGCITSALNGVSLILAENEFLGIMGTSGSGKTTLLNVTSGIDRCDAGEIYIWGNDIRTMTKNELSSFRRENIGMVFQDFNLLSSLTIKENIMVPLLLDGKYEMTEDGSIDCLADAMDISDILERYPYEISGGQQQRAAICRAIVNHPKILFADEPTGNLDSKTSEKILSYFELVHDEFKTAILMVTHDPFTASHCDRVVFMEDGRVNGGITRKSDDGNFFNDILEMVRGMNNAKGA